MPTKDPIKKAKANRERQARFRAKKKGVTVADTKADVTPSAPPKPQGVTSPVTQADYDALPPSLKFQVEAGTRLRQTLHAPLEIKERQEMAVRRFRGY
ncbi:MAG: hypothetical protein PHI12_08795 [Dehalococcoidales bacterium]|nr:hypothetical protein [Dehalococcoidales bacterium]